MLCLAYVVANAMNNVNKVFVQPWSLIKIRANGFCALFTKTHQQKQIETKNLAKNVWYLHVLSGGPSGWGIHIFLACWNEDPKLTFILSVEILFKFALEVVTKLNLLWFRKIPKNTGWPKIAPSSWTTKDKNSRSSKQT